MEQSGQSRVALLGIMVEDSEAAPRVNGLLHEYGSYIVGRMGLPYRERRLNIISVVLDAPQEVVSALSGKLGMISGVSSKCLYAATVQPYGTAKPKSRPCAVLRDSRAPK